MDVSNDLQTSDSAVTATRLEERPGQEDLARKRQILTEYRQLLAKDPRNVGLLNEVGMAAEAAGDHDRARWAYKRAIRLDPGYEPSYLNLGLLDQKDGREESAADALQSYAQWAGDEVDAKVVRDAPASMVVPEQDVEARTSSQAPIYRKLNQAWEEMGLTPAEAMLLLDPENSSGQQMMQYTLLDLVARGILEADERLRVGRGEGFEQTELAPHERLFAKYFSRISDYVDIDKLARAALAEMNDDDGVFKGAYVRQSLLQKGYLEYETTRILGLIPTQQIVPSSKGIRARNRLNRLLKEADEQMARSIARNPEQAEAYVDKGGPALLLMDAYPLEYFQKWEKMLTSMGFGPGIQRFKSKARQSELGAYIDDFLKALLGS